MSGDTFEIIECAKSSLRYLLYALHLHRINYEKLHFAGKKVMKKLLYFQFFFILCGHFACEMLDCEFAEVDLVLCYVP